MEGQQLSQQDHLKEKIRIELEFARTGVINHSDIRRRTGVKTAGGTKQRQGTFLSQDLE